MRCRRARRRLSAWLDGELGTAQQKALEGHLRACPDCARESHQLAQTWERAGTLPEMDRRPGFDAALWARIHEREARAARMPGWWPILPRLGWATIAGLSVAATVWLGIVLGSVVGRETTGDLPVEAEARRKAVLDSLHVETFRDLPSDSVGGGALRLASNGPDPQGRRSQR